MTYGLSNGHVTSKGAKRQYGRLSVSGRYTYPIHAGDGRYTYRAGVEPRHA